MAAGCSRGFDSPGAQSRGIVGLMNGKTLVGGLVEGWIATELEKRRIGVRRPTGDLYVFPLIAGIAITLKKGLNDHEIGRIIPFDTYNLFYRDGLEHDVLEPLRASRSRERDISASSLRLQGPTS